MVELHITYDETTGHVNVTGPIGNKGLSYLMIECARDAIKDHTDKAQKAESALITPVNNNIDKIGFIRRANKRIRR